MAPAALLDGGMGTALRARGLPAEAFPEEWVLRRPEEVARVHAAHAGAGAGTLLTCTFNAARAEARGLEAELERICARAVELARGAAREAAGRRPPGRGPPGAPATPPAVAAARVAGCAGATGLVAASGEGPPDAELRERFERPFRALAAAGADLLWTETHVSLREARAALAAARRTGLPTVATLVLAERDGELGALDGTPGPEALRALWLEGAAAVGVNCGAPGRALAALAARAAAAVAVPVVVKPSAGLPGGILPPSRFAAGVAAAVRAGARMAGGCCGAEAAHLAALRELLRRG